MNYNKTVTEDGTIRWRVDSCILPWTRSPWEVRSIFLNFLIPKLPAPKDEDLFRGIFEAIDMDSYRIER